MEPKNTVMKKEIDDTKIIVHAYSVAQSCPTLVTSWTEANQTLLSMGFSRQEYWSKLPCPPPGYLPDPGIEPTSLVSPALKAGSLPLAGTSVLYFQQ